MMRRATVRGLVSVSVCASVLLILLLVLPFVALLLASSPSELSEAVRHRLFWPALSLTATTSVASVLILLLAGTPLAWWLATSSSRAVRVVETAVDLPIVVPPAVVGIALLTFFGREGALGGVLSSFELSIPFTTPAVVIAQVVVSAPFYIQSACNAFRSVDLDQLLVARTLGASSLGAFGRVAVPIAMPGLLGGAALAWARAIGEFGATLLFAGNLRGTTQTMPLAIYGALEVDVRVAIALSLVLAGLAVGLLFILRLGPSAYARRRGAASG